MTECNCSEVDHDRVVADGVTAVVQGISDAALPVVRNGGWELWFRNLLLMNLERDRTLGSIGFTERRGAGRRRADVVFDCLACPRSTLALEVKTNFLSQSKRVRSRINDAREQLKSYVEQDVPSFLIYSITHLWFTPEDRYVTKHNGVLKRTGYKHFRKRGANEKEEWADTSLSPENQLAEARIKLGSAHALIGVWAARVTRGKYPLRFIRQDEARGR